MNFGNTKKTKASDSCAQIFQARSALYRLFCPSVRLSVHHRVDDPLKAYHATVKNNQTSSDVGIYKRKQESKKQEQKNSTKTAIKKKRKQELDQ